MEMGNIVVSFELASLASRYQQTEEKTSHEAVTGPIVVRASSNHDLHQPGFGSLSKMT